MQGLKCAGKGRKKQFFVSKMRSVHPAVKQSFYLINRRNPNYHMNNSDAVSRTDASEVGGMTRSLVSGDPPSAEISEQSAQASVGEMEVG